MGDIYSLAQSVCIWLGPGDSTTNRVMDTLNTFCLQDKFLDKDEDDFVYHDIPPTTILSRLAWRWARKDLVPGLFHHSLSRQASPDMILEFLDHRWARRIWTLQEAVLATKPWIRCGTRRLSWKSMIYAVSCLSVWTVHFFYKTGDSSDSIRHWRELLGLWITINHGTTFEDFTDRYRAFIKHEQKRTDSVSLAMLPIFWSLGLLACLIPIYVSGAVLRVVGLLSYVAALMLILAIVFPRHATAPYSIWRARWSDIGSDSQSATPTRSTIEAMVYEILRRETTDPCDKFKGVYAVLASPHFGIPLSTPSEETTQGSLYRELLFKLLNKSKNLNLLLYAPGVEGQPSWVPNWNAIHDERWYDEAESTEIGTRMRATNIVNPSRDMFRFEGETGLVVHGFEIGSIVCVGDEFLPDIRDSPPAVRQLHISNMKTIQDALRWGRQESESAGRQYWDKRCKYPYLFDDNKYLVTNPSDPLRYIPGIRREKRTLESKWLETAFET